MTRYRTTVAGARIIQRPSTSLYDHVTKALASARGGSTAWVKASDGPGSAHYAVEFRLLDGTVRVTPTVGAQPLDTRMPDTPSWIRELIEITNRLTGGNP